MDESIREALWANGGKMKKNEYRKAQELEKSKLTQQLVFMTLVSAGISVILYLSLIFDLQYTAASEGYQGQNVYS